MAIISKILRVKTILPKSKINLILTVKTKTNINKLRLIKEVRLTFLSLVMRKTWLNLDKVIVFLKKMKIELVKRSILC